MKRAGLSLSILIFFLCNSLFFSSEKAGDNRSEKKILTNCSIIDCTGKKLEKDMTLVITGNKITDIYHGEYNRKNEKDEEVFDLKGGYVLPGLWNVHMHLAALLPDPNRFQDNEPLPSATIRAGLNAMEGLQHGFTGVRTVGEDGYLDVAWRDVFNQGFFLGPRIFTCGEAISVTGGHRGDMPDGADGASELRKAVRTRVMQKVDWIKIMGVEMLDDELKAVLDTAHHLGLRVASHSKEPSSYRSVKAGVDSIEHGYGLSDKTIKLMAEKGTFYVPTIVCNLSDAYIKERELRLDALGFSKDKKIVDGRIMVAYADERTQKHAEHQRNALVKAFKSGVKVCVGSDSTPVGELGLLEIEQFVISGVSEMDALIAATRNCADLCGVADKLGTIEKGKLADILVVTENPLENISNLRKVKMVFKDGIVVDLTKKFGPKSYWDYYFTPDSEKGYASEADASAGFKK